MDSIHIAKLRREQEELQNQPMKAVDSIAVTKARREQAQISRDVERDLLIARVQCEAPPTLMSFDEAGQGPVRFGSWSSGPYPDQLDQGQKGKGK